MGPDDDVAVGLGTLDPGDQRATVDQEATSGADRQLATGVDGLEPGLGQQPGRPLDRVVGGRSGAEVVEHAGRER